MPFEFKREDVRRVNTYIHRRLNMSFRYVVRLNLGPPRIEVVGIHEAYLLSKVTGERIKRICGAQLKGYPQGFVCLTGAGRGTGHYGYGYCRSHDNIWSKYNFKHWIAQIRGTLGSDPLLQQIYSGYMGRSLEEVEDLKEDIHLLDTLKTYLIMTLQSNVDEVAFYAALLSKILNRKAQLVELSYKMRKELFFSPQLIEELLKDIIKEIRVALPKKMEADRVIQIILNTVVLPKLELSGKENVEAYKKFVEEKVKKELDSDSVAFGGKLILPGVDVKEVKEVGNG